MAMVKYQNQRNCYIFDRLAGLWYCCSQTITRVTIEYLLMQPVSKRIFSLRVYSPKSCSIRNIQISQRQKNNSNNHWVIIAASSSGAIPWLNSSELLTWIVVENVYSCVQKYSNKMYMILRTFNVYLLFSVKNHVLRRLVQKLA